MELELTKEQGELLERLLKNALGEIRTEVRHTHEADFKDYLKHNEHVLREVIEKLQPAAARVGC